MASRKKKESPQLGFSLPVSSPKTPLTPDGAGESSSIPVDSSQALANAPSGMNGASYDPEPARGPDDAGTFHLDELDDYDENDGKHELADPSPRVRVTAERDGFLVSRIRVSRSYAQVFFTREELTEFLERARAALEITC